MCQKHARKVKLLMEYYKKTQQYFRDEALKKDRQRKLLSMNEYYDREIRKTKPT